MKIVILSKKKLLVKTLAAILVLGAFYLFFPFSPQIRLKLSGYEYSREEFFHCIHILGKSKELELFLKAGMSPNAIYETDPVLFLALENRNDEAIQLLLEYGADVNATSGLTHLTALMLAAIASCNAETFEKMIDSGADVNATTPDGYTVLFFVRGKDICEKISLLKENGADMDALTKMNGDFIPAINRTALHHCAMDSIGETAAENLEKAECLIRNSANINATDSRGYTPLMDACARRSMEMVKLLVRHGARVNEKNKYLYSGGYSALQLTLFERTLPKYHDQSEFDKASRESFIIVKYLIQNGADPNHAGTDETTALMMAAQQGNVDTVKFLLEHGANPGAVNLSDYSALKFAKEAMQNRDEIVALLKDALNKEELASSKQSNK
jgi:ankyrin repeat protein